MKRRGFIKAITAIAAAIQIPFAWAKSYPHFNASQVLAGNFKYLGDKREMIIANKDMKSNVPSKYRDKVVFWHIPPSKSGEAGHFGWRYDPLYDPSTGKISHEGEMVYVTDIFRNEYR